MSESHWPPRAPQERLAGMAWLPRLIDKGRRFQRGGQALLGDYMFGDYDVIDALVLHFLRLKDQDVLAILAETSDDETAAAQIIARSRRTPAELDRWSRRFIKTQAFFIFVINVDEGRSAKGPVGEALRLWYNHLLLPPVLAVYRLLERRRQLLAPYSPASGAFGHSQGSR